MNFALIRCAFGEHEWEEGRPSVNPPNTDRWCKHCRAHQRRTVRREQVVEKVTVGPWKDWRPAS